MNDRNQLSGDTAPPRAVDYTHILTHCEREGDTGLLISFKCFTLSLHIGYITLLYQRVTRKPFLISQIGLKKSKYVHKPSGIIDSPRSPYPLPTMEPSTGESAIGYSVTNKNRVRVKTGQPIRGHIPGVGTRLHI